MFCMEVLVNTFISYSIESNEGREIYKPFGIQEVIDGLRYTCYTLGI